ncbi:JAB domain-containing protein [Streptococcus pseudopneumoniae]|uniref:RadC family protein n=1 Tax=Streptococcus pseudopneumoniae TaxID=257758 RepID=UPI00110C21BA|nr:DNA repair protein RadC [Streptococcus pseudopneumoniae]NIB89052.1 JAB domain-containing protein [Streptococcus pseudopneumoniae]TMR80769.1 JAB domain-containing protein [Streptococcus pseudopneumoniae]
MYSISFQEDSLLPRERLAKEGVEALSNQELLAILLRTGTRQASVFEIAQKVLSNLSSLTDLKKMTLQELQSLSGIGRVKAIELQAMIELGHRIHKHETLEMESILSSQKLAKKMQQELGHKKQEHLVALYLNTQNQIIHQQTIFIGSATRSIAEPREILHYAIKHMATSLILVHNHPSGAVAPSRNDDHVTKLVKDACDLMGIVLLDHLIVSHSNYFSYREKTDLI